MGKLTNESFEDIIKKPTKKDIMKDMYPDSEDSNFITDLVEEKKLFDFKNLKDKLSKNNKHLQFYDNFKKEVGLKGETYEPILRLQYYQMHSICQESKQFKVNKNLSFDNHIHSMIMLPMGSGKGMIKNYEKYFARKLGKDRVVLETTSISHAEQLIGKVKTIKGKKGEGDTKEINYGWLKAKGLMIDEAQDLLNEINTKESEIMRILRQGMDSYGHNYVTKKLVDDNFNDILNYPSETNVSVYTHLVQLNNKFIESGTARRFLGIFSANSDNEIDLENITNIKLDLEEEKEEFIEYMKKNYEFDEDIELKYNQECLDLVLDMHREIISFLVNSGDKNLVRYGYMYRYVITLQLMRLVNVLHISKKLKELDPITTLQACLDGFYFIINSIETLSKYSNMKISNDVWHGCTDEEKLVLDWLLRTGATSEKESEISIKQFNTATSEIFGLANRQSRRYKHKLQEMGLISSKKGQYESKVWLNSIPKGIFLKNQVKPFHILNLIISDLENTKDEEIMGLYHKYIEKTSQSGQSGTFSRVPSNNIYTDGSLNFIYLLLLYIEKKGVPLKLYHSDHNDLDDKIEAIKLDDNNIKEMPKSIT